MFVSANGSAFFERNCFGAALKGNPRGTTLSLSLSLLRGDSGKRKKQQLLQPTLSGSTVDAESVLTRVVQGLFHGFQWPDRLSS